VSDLFFDPFRKKWVKKRPEELIRQALLHKMVHELSYPPAYIAIETSLHTLPHLSASARKSLPSRRLDIVVFAKNLHRDYPLFPLLLLECKVDCLNADNAQQLIGYNDVVKAPFIALANVTAALTGRYDQERGGYHFVSGLFPYSELLNLTQR